MTSVSKRHVRGFVWAAAVVAIASVAYGDPIELMDGVPVTGLSGAFGIEREFSIVVPAGQGELEISTSGGTGDCDLYVRRDGSPSYGTYDYRPFLFGNNETVVVTDPAAGTWYIMVRGHDAYSGVTLLATCRPAVPTELANGVPLTGLSGGSNTEKLYCIDVPAGQNSLEVNTWGGTGDLDLCVKYGSAPGLYDFDGRSFGPSTHEEVTISHPAAGRWYIMLYASTRYSQVTLRASYGSSGSVLPVQDEVPITGLSGALGSEVCYVIDVPRGQDGIDFRIFGGTGDCDMYIKKAARPTQSDWDYRPADRGNEESISVTGDDLAGQWYILLVADQAYSGVTLRVDYFAREKPAENVTRLTQGVPVTDIAGKAGSEQFFSIDVPSTVQTLEIKMTGGTGDADLYVRKGELPTTSQYDYRPYLTGSTESVTVTKSAGGTWYILIRGYQAFSGVTLLVTFDVPTPDGVTTLLNGVSVSGLAGAVASEKFFKIEVPAGQTKLEIAMSGGTGDADLYVRVGDKPTTHVWDYRPFVLGNVETVTIDTPKAGTYYILIRGYRAYTGVTLKATYGPGSELIKTLDNCVPVASLTGAQESETFFKIDVPAGQDSLRIAISGGTGDADLYVKKGEKPTAKSWDYHPGLHGNDESVEVKNPAAATWYIMVRGYQAYADVSLRACFKTAQDDCGCGGHSDGCDGSCDCGGSCGCDGSGGCDDSCGCDGGWWIIIE
jgi:hypothetical protein